MATVLLGGAEKNALDTSGEPPLTIAARQGHFRVVEILAAAGANLNIHGGFGGWAALHGAAWNGDGKRVSALLLYGANMDALDSNGEPPLTCAATVDAATFLSSRFSWPPASI